MGLQLFVVPFCQILVTVSYRFYNEIFILGVKDSPLYVYESYADKHNGDNIDVFAILAERHLDKFNLITTCIEHQRY